MAVDPRENTLRTEGLKVLRFWRNDKSALSADNHAEGFEQPVATEIGDIHAIHADDMLISVNCYHRNGNRNGQSRYGRTKHIRNKISQKRHHIFTSEPENH
ncbi:MAG: hypothetical protein AAGA08_07455 [Pseudomonadota bacterium]